MGSSGLIALILILTLEGSAVSGFDRIHCIKPITKESSSTVITCRNRVCKTLGQFSSAVDQYITNNTKIIFLPGVHDLYGNIAITNVRNLELTGKHEDCNISNTSASEIESSAYHQEDQMPQITCSGKSGFIFQNIINLTVCNLFLYKCGQPVPVQVYNPEYGLAQAALGFNEVSNLVLSNLAIHNSSGYGILTHNIYGVSSVLKCNLHFNRGARSYRGGNAHFNYTQCNNRGKIELKIEDSIFSHGSYDSPYNDLHKTGIFATGIGITLSCTNITVHIHNTTLEYNDNNTPIGFGGNLFIHFYNGSDYISNTIIIDQSRFLSGNSFVGGGIGISMYIGSSSTSHNLTCINSFSIASSDISSNKATAGSGLYVNIVQELLNPVTCRVNFELKDSVLNHNEVVVLKNKKDIKNIGVAINIIYGLHSGVSQKDRANKFVFDNITLQYNKFLIQDYLRLVSGSAALHLINFLGSFLIRDSRIQHNNITGISAYHSYLTFGGRVILSNNTGMKGGGMIVCESTKIILTPNVTVEFTDNHALHSGGGIYAEGQCAGSLPLCFYMINPNNTHCGSYLDVANLASDCGVRVVMTNNTADYAGNQIYGGSVGYCYSDRISVIQNYSTFRSIFKLNGRDGPDGPDLSSITSDPQMGCFCSNNLGVNCTQKAITYPWRVYPGEYISIFIVVVGQLNGTVPGSLKVNTTSEFNGVHSTTTDCLPVKFTTHSCNYSDTIYEFEVYSHSPNTSYHYTIGQARYVRVKFKECPLGHKLNTTTCTCDCNTYWKGIECDIKELTLHRSPPSWLGIMEGNLVHQENCPYDYCRKDKVTLKVTANGIFNPDVQCSPERTGVLCGACRKGYTVPGSSSNCADCTKDSGRNVIIFLISQLLLGIILVFLLTIFNWTITDGSFSGLLFYANIFKLNSFIYFPNTANFFTVVISWINMDFNLTRCVFNGMDSYAKAWLAFFPPLYVWMLIGTIILLSRRFKFMSKLFGGNEIKILATLTELSYSGLTQAVITALSGTVITYTTTTTTDPAASVNITSTITTKHLHYVWLFDGNVSYLKGKHIPLFIFGLLFAMLITMHTFILLFVQPLQRYSHLRCLSWVAKLKPWIDAYTTPHIVKEKFRFWVGFLLAIRLLLAVTFASNAAQTKDLNLSATVSACLLILTVASSVGGIYKKTHLNILNVSFILNLALLSILAGYGTNIAIAYSSASIAVATICYILGIRIYCRLRPLVTNWKVRNSYTPIDVADVEWENSDASLPQLREEASLLSSS